MVLSALISRRTVAPMGLAGWDPHSEPLEEDAARERNKELDAIAERERISESAVPHQHPVRRFFARLRRKR